ncbi:hypothetical protein ACHWQZ_G010272 [Mnemiopsis leidyi]
MFASPSDCLEEHRKAEESLVKTRKDCRREGPLAGSSHSNATSPLKKNKKKKKKKKKKNANESMLANRLEMRDDKQSGDWEIKWE